MATSFTREQFAWIVSQRARFIPAEKIVGKFGVRWKDTACTLVDVAGVDDVLSGTSTDPNAAHWKAFFEAEREAFRDAPLADKANRIGKLNDFAMDAEARNSPDVAARFIEQIAKEVADAYTPKGSAVGKPGATAPGTEQEPIEEIRVTVVDPRQPEQAAP